MLGRQTTGVMQALVLRGSFQSQAPEPLRWCHVQHVLLTFTVTQILKLSRCSVGCLWQLSIASLGENLYPHHPLPILRSPASSPEPASSADGASP